MAQSREELLLFLLHQPAGLFGKHGHRGVERRIVGRRVLDLLDQILDEPSTPTNLRARAKDLAAYYRTLSPAEAAVKPQP